jgi:hypothetical protein
MNILASQYKNISVLFHVSAIGLLCDSALLWTQNAGTEVKSMRSNEVCR